MKPSGSEDSRTSTVIRGIAVSPGVTVATVYRLETASPSDLSTEAPIDVPRELKRFSDACEAAAQELTDLIERVSTEIGAEESRIFQSHLFMLRDRAFVGKVNSAITERLHRAEQSLAEATAEYEKIFGSITDEYLRERIVDLRDVAARISNHLTEEAILDDIHPDKPVVIVARDILPSQTLHFGQLQIAALVTEQGSRTGHAAIIARSLGMPAVSGLVSIMEHVRNGDTIVVDGREGLVIINPEPEAKAAYHKIEREFYDLKDKLVENRDLEAVSKDGVSIELLANVNNESDAKAAAEVGAVGIGLFRTEYVFMTHPSIPSEEDQYQSYSRILSASPNQRLTIRTLDIGGDKTVPYFTAGREPNPFMGWRSIRVSFSHPDFFQNQLRAILRMNPGNEMKILLPMVTTVDEVIMAHQLIDESIDQLKQKGVAVEGNWKRGVMIEVPAAAICIDQIIKHVDFVSIGSNDLVQYLMAADRDNPRVASLCDPLSPAALRLTRHVIETCNRANIPVTLCGEMAGRPSSVVALLSFGLRSFSMSPAFVPLIKDLVRAVSLDQLTDLADELVAQTSTPQVYKILCSHLTRIAPHLARLDVNR
ncbi:phosphoenolpyruvate--protein phosphotransferase [bacterium]|nr:phosphoenolpyruvate--protein phosphotransferase [bacterium]